MLNFGKSSKYTCVFDIGGTNFRSGVYYQGNLVEEPLRLPTPTFITHPEKPIDELQEMLIEDIVKIIVRYSERYKRINRVSIAIAGLAEDNSVVVQSPSIWGNQGLKFDLKATLEARISGINVFVANDLTAAAEKYASLADNKNIDYFAIFSISTGIGAKIYDVRNKKVLFEPKILKEEIGHRLFDSNSEAPVCDCGGKGHINSLSSGRAIVRQTITSAKQNIIDYKKSYLASQIKSPNDITSVLFAKALKQNDSFAKNLLDKATFPIAKIITEFYQKNKVRKVIIVGGFALSIEDIYLKSLLDNLVKIGEIKLSLDKISDIIVFGTAKDDDCLLGVGILFERNFPFTKG